MMLVHSCSSSHSSPRPQGNFLTPLDLCEENSELWELLVQQGGVSSQGGVASTVPSDDQVQKVNCGGVVQCTWSRGSGPVYVE